MSSGRKYAARPSFWIGRSDWRPSVACAAPIDDLDEAAFERALKEVPQGNVAAQVPAVPPRDLIEVLERVLTKGVIFEIDEEVEASATDRDAAASVRISIAGVDVFKVEGRVAWRYLLEPGLDKKE